MHQPGAGGLVAAGVLQNTAPKDGTTIGFLQRNNLLEPVMAEKEIGFDPKRVAWVGSLNRDTYVVIAWHTSGAKTIQDAMARELVLGNTGGGNENLTFPLMLNQIAGTKFKLVRGYKGSDEVAVAIERGEVQGRAMSWASFKGEHTPWLNEKKVNILVQIAQKRHPDLPDVPLAMDFVKTDADRQLADLLLSTLDAGRPFAVPLDVPADRIAAIRAAFEALTKDKAFVDEVKSRGGSVEFMSGVEMQALAERLPKTPKDLLDRARAIVKAN